MPELQAVGSKSGGLLPHELARKFVIEEGNARGGVEVLVVLDSQNKFIGAGTSMQPDFVNFPEAVKVQEQDPKARLTVHHNHPKGEEDFFSDQDMQGIAQRRGIGWMLMHNEAGFSAMRVSDQMFKPDAAGNLPVDGLTTAYRKGKLSLLHNMHTSDITAGLDEDARLKAASELTLQALQQAGAIQHYSSHKTGLRHEHEQGFIQQLRREAAASPEYFGGASIWSGAASPASATAPGGKPRSGRYPALSHTSTLETQYDRFLDILSRQDPQNHDPANAGRPQPPEIPAAGRGGSGLASNRPTGRPLLEGGPGKGPGR